MKDSILHYVETGCKVEELHKQITETSRASIIEDHIWIVVRRFDKCYFFYWCIKLSID